MNLLTFFLLYNSLYLFLDFLYKNSKKNKKELFRKIAHIWTWIITFISLNFLNIKDYIILIPIFIIWFLFIRKFNIIEFVTDKKRGYWDIYFIIWQAILIVFMNYNIIITKIWLLILTLSDWLAPFWKKIYKKKLYNKKTFWWTFLFFLVSILILFNFYWFSFKIIIFSFLLTLVELFSFKWLDNIFLPFFSILILFYYDKIFYL